MPKKTINERQIEYLKFSLQISEAQWRTLERAVEKGNTFKEQKRILYGDKNERG